MKRKAFSLLEMSIVLAILAIVISTSLPFLKSKSELKKIETTKYDIQTVKNSLIAYLSVHGRLPRSDTNGDGIGDTTGLGNLPLLDLNTKILDKYGMQYQYDVSDNLAGTTIISEGEIIMINHSLEDTNLNDEEWSTSPVGWTTGGEGGDYNPGDIYVDNSQIDGDNIAYLDAGNRQMSQTLSETLANDTNYTLNIDVIHLQNYGVGQSENYSIKLYAGNEVVLEIDEDDVIEIEGEVVTATKIIDTSTLGGGFPGFGQVLKIEINNYDNNDELYFDNVVLTKDPYEISKTLIYPSDICEQLETIYLEQYDMNTSTHYPQMVDESNVSQYAVAAVIISKGANKVLSGANSGGNRKYEMASNSYVENSRDDLVVEIGSVELLEKVCGIDANSIKIPNVKVKAVAGEVHYIKSDKPTDCKILRNNRDVKVEDDQTITFYRRGDTHCIDDGNSVFQDYTGLRAIDADPADYLIYVIKEVDDNHAPTLEDN